ncbi:MAG: hypothetical protein M0R48_10765 [Candidatus Omnitrophica bacterium]|nr:hypothetical protein [Candidatus Omnitrophota bacterium]
MNDLSKFDDNLNFSNYSYCSRRIQPVELPNGDIYIFFVDMSPDAGEMDFDMKKTVNGKQKDITTKKMTDVYLKKGMRTLVGGRTGLSGLASPGLKWVGWKSEDDGDENLPWKFYPFYEVYDFSVSYNKAHNIISLFFWTNIVDTSDGENFEGYSYEKIAFQYAPNEFMSPSTYADFSTVQKVLCYAKGRFIQGSINATVEASSSENAPFVKCVEYIPIFEKPTVIHKYKNADARITDFGFSGEGYAESPWQISFEQDNEGENGTVVNYAVFKHLFTRKGGVFVIHESEGTELRVALPMISDSSERLYVGLVIDTSSGEYEIKMERTLAALQGNIETDHADLWVSIPLYILVSSGISFRVLVDLRKTITQDIYE